MRTKIQNIWENVSAGLWFVPSILIVAALLLSSLFIELDVILTHGQSPLVPWLFSGTADAARTLLAAIAGSLITVISIVFSITIIALQQAASQFSPRVLRLFTSNRSNQVVIGVYIATFIYALLVLRSIRSATEDPNSGFVPALSVTAAMFLAVLCLGLLIYFIHHMAQSLQIGVVMNQLRHEVIHQIDTLYLASSDASLAPVEPERSLGRRDTAYYVYADQAGFVRKINEAALLKAPFGPARWLWVRARVGDFIPYGGILAEIDDFNQDEQDDGLIKHIREAFVIDTVRSINQDPMFGIRQLVDIALKALSPGINDPTTAEHVLFHLGDALGRLAKRCFPPNERIDKSGRTHLIFNQATWDDFVEAAFDQIRREAADDVHVTGTLLQVLHSLALCVPSGPRCDAIRQQVTQIRQSIGQQSFSPTDEAKLKWRVEQVEGALRSKIAVA
jgi:uncharacterized membrane protein